MSATGRVTLVTAADGTIIPVNRRPGTARVEPLDFFAQYGAVFGVMRPGDQLVLSDARVDELGFARTSYQQVHGGIPVYSGVLRVHQNAGGDVVAANGRFYEIPEKLNPVPALTADAAVDIARAALPVEAAGALLIESDLVIVDPGWYGDPSWGPRLAYYVELVHEAALVHEAFFVNAQNGTILDQWSRVCTLRDRRIYNGSGITSFPGTPGRLEGDPLSIYPDVNRAYDYYGDVYDYYFRAFGRDSIDGAGLPMVATVNFSATGYCPNASWIPSLRQMIFCPGTVTDDIVAHELTHGVTNFTANLIYQNQSGQLNEAFSDIFGELVDLFNGNGAFLGETGGPAWPTHPTGAGRDTPNVARSACSHQTNGYADGVRWLMGEDAIPFGGAIRDMWIPTCFGDPDRANSELQRCEPWDNGGVHIGSLVPLHAFAMATDGKSFNGYSVNGIGPIKTGAVYYRALTTYLTPASDFEETYYLVNRAAQDLIGTFPNDPRTGQASTSEFTAADAAEIDKAMLAAEMNTRGSCGVEQLLNSGSAPVCPERTTLFLADFESGAAGWQTVNVSGSSSPQYQWILRSNLPDGRSGNAWFGPARESACGGGGSSGLRQLVSPEITLPAALTFPALKFEHFVQTEFGFDGGNLKIRVNGGAWTLVQSEAFVFNPYNIAALDSGTAIDGEPGFSGGGGEWYTSVVNLRNLASGGDTIQFRFDLTTDVCAGLVGWYIDDVEVYDCSIADDCNLNGIPDDSELALGPHPEAVANQPAAPSGFVRLGTDFFFSVFGAIDYGMSYADDFFLHIPKRISAVRIWGGYVSDWPGDQEFRVQFRGPDLFGRPGNVLNLPPFEVQVFWHSTDVVVSGLKIWEIELRLVSPVLLPKGHYFVEVNRTSTLPGDFFWQLADFGSDQSIGRKRYYVADDEPATQWFPGANVDLAMRVEAGVLGSDCNLTGVPDDCEIATGLAPDDNGNGLPDACDPDCNGNGRPDDLDVMLGFSADCNGDLMPNECDGDCNGNGVSDRCDLVNAVYASPATDQCADAKPICGGIYAGSTVGASKDGSASCGGSSNAPDVWYRYTPMTTGYLVVSTCDTDFDTVVSIHAGCPGSAVNQRDCNDDWCFAIGGSRSYTAVVPGTTYYVRVSGFNGQSGDFKLQVDLAAPCLDAALVDCDDDGVLNSCDLAAGAPDCNHNLVPDSCDIALGISKDCNLNTVPDSCEPDNDGDGVINACDGCPNDANKTAPGVCGCGNADFDSDFDGALDCLDGCPFDYAKTAPGICGCNVAESTQDSDADGSADCVDGCPNDPAKKAPGKCGCGVAETDTDGDGVPNCLDRCAEGDDRIDTDKDGTPDCADGCPSDAKKVDPGQCGCGASDDDPDRDGVATCVDNCPMNANPAQEDTDVDGVGDMCDGCPFDPNKTAPGVCGCGLVDVDSDGDGLYDCADPCPNDPTSNNMDTDNDGVGDACDDCPFDENKTAPGICGCGRSDADIDGDGVAECDDLCFGTPPGVTVDTNGCSPTATPPPQPTPAPDADNDGVSDELDACPGTSAGAAVDAVGCPVGASIDDGSDDPACGSIGAVAMLLMVVGLAGMRQRMR